MCGIVGYVGHQPAQPVLVRELSRLEYRGYDSCGIAVLDPALSVRKTVGRVEQLARILQRSNATIGIGHTRWATHGTVNEANAHPHIDCTRRFAVVHNGIIENYEDVRHSLRQEGHLFASETDTEIIAHLIEKHYTGDLAAAVAQATSSLKGSFAIIAIAEGSAELVGARRDSPLVIGIGDQENFVASDVSAMLDYTDRAIYLEDGDICSITPDRIETTNGVHTVSRKFQVVPWSAEQVQKGGYEHFMLKEIHEQARVVSDTLAGRIALVPAEIKLDFERPLNPPGIVLTACGSSYHAGLLGEYLLNRVAKTRAKAVIASEFDSIESTLDRDWVVAITQSGETADTLRAIKLAKSAGCPTLAVVNVQGSNATRLCDSTLFVRAGPEVSVAATKTFMAQAVAMYLLTLAQSRLDPKSCASLIEGLRQVPALIDRLLEQEEEIAKHASFLAGFPGAYFVARGLNYPIALEGALKTKEVSYIHAEAHAAGELKHGPFALLGKDMPVVVIVAEDATLPLMKSSIREIKARSSPVIAIVDEKNDDTDQYVDHTIKVPTINPVLSPLLNTLVVQLIAYYVAKARGRPIDRPANLAKSVTVL